MSRFLVTGGAGFIGSHIADALVARGDEVRVIDDFSSGRRQNLDEVEDKIELFEGSVCDDSLMAEAMAGVDYCVHQAAIPSVPRSIDDPVATNAANVEGTLKMLLAARDAGVRRVVCASSSSVYGDSDDSPTTESTPLNPLSPYAVSKAAGEMYAWSCSQIFDIDVVSLRYFNVFGPRQDPDSPYAAVIPIFLERMLAGTAPCVEGDGKQSRDFSFVDNVVQANILACEVQKPISGAYNIACGATTTILDLVDNLNELLGTDYEPEFAAPRPGDVRCSWADISLARETFGYEPRVSVRDGLERTVEWHRRQRGAG